MSVFIRPSPIADSFIPVESIRTPFPVSSYKQNVNSLLLSLPIWIRTTSFWSLNCIVFPTIASPPSSDLIWNLSAEMVPAFNIDTVIWAAINSLITASSIITFFAVSLMICPSSADTLPANKSSIFPTFAFNSWKSPDSATIFPAEMSSDCKYWKNPFSASILIHLIISASSVPGVI